MEDETIKNVMVGNEMMKRLSRMIWTSRIAIGLSLALLAVLTIMPVAVASHGNGLIHRYKFDEKSGLIALDHHKTGAVNGALSTTVNRVKGLTGRGAVELTGQASSVVSFGGGVGQFGTSDFTVAFWLKTSETGLRLFDLVGNRTAGSHGNFFQLRMTGTHPSTGNGRIIAEIDQDPVGTNYIALISGPGFNDGQPHHVAVSRQGVTMLLYVDGVAVASGSATGVANVANGNAFKIGRSLNDPCCLGNFTPVATFDELRIYNRALTAEQIKDLADADETVTSIPFWIEPSGAQGMTISGYPNPANPNVIVRYTLPAPAMINVSLYSVSGGLVEILYDGFSKAGTSEMNLNASRLSSGVYFARITSNFGIAITKLSIVR